MYPPQRIVTDLPKEQIIQAIKELDQSIEADKTEIGLYQIVLQRLSAARVSELGEPKTAAGLDYVLREKDEVTRILQGLIEKKYDEINGKQDVMGFLSKLTVYAR